MASLNSFVDEAELQKHIEEIDELDFEEPEEQPIQEPIKETEKWCFVILN